MNLHELRNFNQGSNLLFKGMEYTPKYRYNNKCDEIPSYIRRAVEISETVRDRYLNENIYKG